MPIITLDSASKSANITLSAGNLDAKLTGSVTASAARCGTPYRSGLPGRYFEVTITTLSASAPVINILPLANFAAAMTRTTATPSAALYPAGGVWCTYKNNAADYTSAVAAASGAVIGCVFNNVALTCAFYVNGTLLRIVTMSAAITNPIIAVGEAAANDEVVFNFGNTPFTYARPANCIAWQDDKFNRMQRPIISNRPIRHIGL